MTTEAGFRRIALGLEGAEERAHMGHPDFRAAGKIFATLRGDGQRGMVRLSKEDQAAFVSRYPRAFAPESGAWGRDGCTRVMLAEVDEDTLGEALTLAWRAVERAGKAGKAGKAGGAGGAGKARAGAMYVALLRAVNVGGRKPVAMAALCEMFGAAGFRDARSLLQSGNVIFRARGASRTIELLLERTAAAQLQLETDFIVRSAGDWADIVSANPFRAEAHSDPGRLLLLAAKGLIDPGDVRRLQSRIVGRERIAAGERHVYAVYLDGVGRSRLTMALIEKTLGTRVTGRNWNTVLKIFTAVRPVR